MRFVGRVQRTREREALRAFARRAALLARSLGVPDSALQTVMLAIDMEPAIHRELALGADVVTVEHDIAAHLAASTTQGRPGGRPAPLPLNLSVNDSFIRFSIPVYPGAFASSQHRVRESRLREAYLTCGLITSAQ